MKYDTSGPAYPTEVPEDPNGGFGRHIEGGMSIRDYFAAAALNGLLSSQLPAQGVTNKNYADDSYRMADAMLATRSAPAPEPTIPSSDEVPF